MLYSSLISFVINRFVIEQGNFFKSQVDHPLIWSQELITTGFWVVYRSSKTSTWSGDLSRRPLQDPTSCRSFRTSINHSKTSRNQLLRSYQRVNYLKFKLGLSLPPEKSIFQKCKMIAFIQGGIFQNILRLKSVENFSSAQKFLEDLYKDSFNAFKDISFCLNLLRKH